MSALSFADVKHPYLRCGYFPKQYSRWVPTRLSDAHKEAFEDLALSPMEHLVDELHAYLRSVGAESSEVIQVWEKLEPYCVAVPFESDPLTKQYFFGNVKIALAIVESRERAAR